MIKRIHSHTHITERGFIWKDISKKEEKQNIKKLNLSKWSGR